jgi:hypothetical protein
MSGDTPYGMGFDSQRGLHAIVSASPEQARQAVLTWAKDLCWYSIPTPGPALVFAFAPETRFWLHYELAVYTSQHEDGLVGIEFVCSGPARTERNYENMLRLAETFARGVCSQLAAEGATVDPPYFGRSAQDPRRTRILMHILRRAELTFLGLAILGAVLAVVLVPEERVLAGATALWWPTCLSFAAGIVKGYIRGVRSPGNLFALADFLLGAVLLTIGLILALQGVI